MCEQQHYVCEQLLPIEDFCFESTCSMLISVHSNQACLACVLNSRLSCSHQCRQSVIMSVWSVEKHITPPGVNSQTVTHV